MVKSVQNDTPKHIHPPSNQNSDICKIKESWCDTYWCDKSHIVHVNVSLLKHKHQKSSNHNISVKLNLRKYLILSSDTIEQDYFILFFNLTAGHPLTQIPHWAWFIFSSLLSLGYMLGMHGCFRHMQYCTTTPLSAHAVLFSFPCLIWALKCKSTCHWCQGMSHAVYFRFDIGFWDNT